MRLGALAKLMQLLSAVEEGHYPHLIQVRVAGSSRLLCTCGLVREV